ncbi:MAG TPA: hypothetical protein DCG23_05130 [Deltaproteobacteria bacterium]|nr:hypothetical protein [Deltaproteobacteria bacterium]
MKCSGFIWLILRSKKSLKETFKVVCADKSFSYGYIFEVYLLIKYFFKSTKLNKIIPKNKMELPTCKLHTCRYTNNICVFCLEIT